MSSNPGCLRSTTLGSSTWKSAASRRAVGEFVKAGEVEPGFVEGLWHVVTGDALRSTTMSETEVAVFLDRLVQ